MKKLICFIAAAALAGCSTASSAPASSAPQQSSAAPASSAVSEVTAVDLSGTMKAVITGDDWGAVLGKAVITLDGEVDAASLDAADFTAVETKMATDWTSETYEITEQTGPRDIIAAYLSDDRGNPVDAASGSIITLEMLADPGVGGAFNYDMNTSLNNWFEGYQLQIDLAGELTSDGAPVASFSVPSALDLFDAGNKIIPQTEVCEMDSYTAASGITYSYASFTPEAQDKRPLVIWLHGGGEGGTDPNVCLLGNEVISLLSDEFQNVMGGAYVFVPQCPTFWMDDGDGIYVQGWSDPDFVDEKKADSMYVDDLQEMIDWYIESNEGIDTERIIIGGCSNGGYMSVRMILNNPGFYDKAYLSSESYIDSYMSDDDIADLAKTGTWFIYCDEDYGNPPELCSVPTIERLQKINAEDVHVSDYEKVLDTTGRFAMEDGSPYAYDAHWTWTYFFDNAVTDDATGENCWQWLAE